MSDVIKFLLGVLANLRLIHWQTKSYARHVASDSLIAELSALTDTFVEAHMGRHGPPTVTGSIELLDRVDAQKYVKSVRDKLMTFTIEEPDLLSVRDDMLVVLNKTLYLFTLK
jgi:hypothetical protein